MKCDICSKTINNYSAYMSGNTVICNDCGEDALVFNESVDGYVFQEDDHEFITDDALSDIEVFQDMSLYTICANCKDIIPETTVLTPGRGFICSKCLKELED